MQYKDQGLNSSSGLQAKVVQNEEGQKGNRPVPMEIGNLLGRPDDDQLAKDRENNAWFFCHKKGCRPWKHGCGSQRGNQRNQRRNQDVPARHENPRINTVLFADEDSDSEKVVSSSKKNMNSTLVLESTTAYEDLKKGVHELKRTGSSLKSMLRDASSKHEIMR